ncbi:unnamed protein product [Closterium sp. NIES-64]|nr:unnamed protein product [Closterium sp. NIES-64]
MDKYTRVEKPRTEAPISENEIRITVAGKVRNYVTYAATLLQVGDERGQKEVVVKAMGRAISKAVLVAESARVRGEWGEA